MPPLNRRIFLKYALATVSSGLGTVRFASSPAEAAQIHPKPDSLRAGDLLWPRKKETCIPYSKETTSAADDAKRWKEMVEGLLDKAKSRGDEKLLDAAQRLSTMTEHQFNALYLDNLRLDVGVNYSGASFRVGHVAIVGGTQGNLHVIEATPGMVSPIEYLLKCFENGVRQTTYSDWISEHAEQLVWHGRPFPSRPDGDRAKIPSQAANYLGRPYCFDNLNLADAKGFYCSKLVWLSVKEALDEYIDDDPKAQRSFWLSPKQILNSKNVHVLFSPEEYGCL